MRCLWWHAWAPWEIKETADVMRGESKIGVIVVQQRTCYRCGYTQLGIERKDL